MKILPAPPKFMLLLSLFNTAVSCAVFPDIHLYTPSSRKERALSYAFTHAVYAYKLLWPTKLCYDWGFRWEELSPLFLC